MLQRSTTKLIFALLVINLFITTAEARGPLPEAAQIVVDRPECAAFYTTLLNLDKPPPSIEAPAPLTVRLAEETVTEDSQVSPLVKQLAGRMPSDPESRRRQAEELIDMRSAIRDRGEFSDPQLYEKYHALEYRNEQLGLIPNDPAGPKFLQSVLDFPKFSKDEKRAWVNNFGNSRNLQARVKIRALLDKETDPEIRYLLRELSVARGFPINYKRSLADIRQQLLRNNPKGPAAKARFRSELRDMPDEVLAELLNDPLAGVRSRAADGLTGRKIEMISRYLRSNDVDVRIAAAKAMDGRITDGALLLLKRGLRDPDRRVRALSALAVGRFQDPAATDLLVPLLKDPDSLVAHSARKHWVEPPEPGFKPSPVPSTVDAEEGPHFFHDDEVIDFVHSKDRMQARDATRFLAGREVKVLAEAAKADDPFVRIKVLYALENRVGPDENEILLNALKDPVADVREHAVKLLSQDKRIDQEIRKRLDKVATKDTDASVRELARHARLEKSADGINLNLPEYFEKSHLSAALEQEYGVTGLRENDAEALAASGHVYRLPEIDNKISARELVEKQKDFLNSAPPGYRVANIATDPKTGLKAAFYVPHADHSRPVIVAIGGSENLTDALVNMNLGASQARSRALYRFVTDVAATLSSPRSALANSEIIVTGHSLGGAMAQVVGHDLLNELKKRGAQDAATRLRVVSWNGFGGVEALKRAGRFSEETARSLRATNYFVPNDPISRLGTHIGEMVSLPNLKLGQLSAHKMSSLQEAFHYRTAPIADGKNPFKIRTVNVVSKVLGPIADGIQHLRYRRHEADILKTLFEAKLIWAEEEGYKRIVEPFNWLQNEIGDVAYRSERPQDTYAINSLYANLNAEIKKQIEFKQRILKSREKMPIIPRIPELRERLQSHLLP